MSQKPHAPAASAELSALLETARQHQLSPEEIEAQRRSWVIGEIMLDDPSLTRDEAEALYDRAEDCNAPAASPVPSIDFGTVLSGLGIKLPLAPHDFDIGVIVDAEGHDILTVDVNNARPDEEVKAICQYVILACNICGSLRADVVTVGGDNG